MSVVGFDLGNDSSKVGVARRRGIDILQNEVGHRLTPTAVSFSGKQRLIGNDATAQYMSNAQNTIVGIKRLIGLHTTQSDPAVDSLSPYKKVLLPDGSVGVDVSYDDKRETFAVEQLTGAVFSKLKAVAESGLEGNKVSDCVIGVPSWFTDEQRRVVMDAAAVAGLNVLRLLNETTAVALSYGILRPLAKDITHKVMFVDVGQSATSCAVVAFTEGKLNVLSVKSDPYLGARNFDAMLVKHFAAYVEEKYKLKVLTEAKATLKLEKECARVKTQLSANQKVPFNVEYIMNDKDVSGMIDRAEFEALASKDILPRLLVPIKACLEAAGVTKEELQSIEIVGGGVRIPAVQRALTEFFGRDMSKTCDGDESVARGCTLMCAMISPSFKVKEFEVHDVSPYAIELQWGPVPSGDAPFAVEDSTPLFMANNPIPSVKLISFSDRTEPFMLVANYSDPAQLPLGTKTCIGKWIVSGMPGKDANKKAPLIKVRVKLNQHGCIQVTQAQLINEVPVDEDVPMKDANEVKPDAGAPAADETKMDTSDDAAPAAAAPVAAPKKVKIVKTDLQVETRFQNGLSQAKLQQYFEREAAMLQQDKTIAETGEARNQLESYSLEMRSRIQGGDLSAYIEEKDKQPFVDQLQAAEDWIYSDEGQDAQKSEYKSRLHMLKKIGDPIAHRAEEHKQRDHFINMLRQTISQHISLAQSKEEKYSHIEESERHKIVALCHDVESWLKQTAQQQQTLPLFVPPVLTETAMNAKRHEIENLSHSVMNKPKPKPKTPQPEQKPTPPPNQKTPTPEQQKTAEPQQASAEADKMDTQ